MSRCAFHFETRVSSDSDVEKQKTTPFVPRVIEILRSKLESYNEMTRVTINQTTMVILPIIALWSRRSGKIEKIRKRHIAIAYIKSVKRRYDKAENNELAGDECVIRKQNDPSIHLKRI